MKTIIYIMPSNGGDAALMVIAILLGMTLPITPVQILWINMVTAVTLGLALAFEQPEAGVMQRPPRDPRQPMLSGFMLWRIAFVSALLMSGALGLFLWESARGAGIEASRTVAVNALVMGEIFYLFNCRYLYAPVLSREGLFGNRYVLIAISLLLGLQALFTYAPFMQVLFGTTAIDVDAWLRVLGFGVAVFAVVELEKTWLRWRYAVRDFKQARAE